MVPGRVNGVEDGKLKVHIMGCNDNRTTGSLSSIEHFALVSSHRGDAPRPVLVKNAEDDQMRPACGSERKAKDRAIIRYVRGKRNEDEVVDRSRIRLAFPD